MMERVPPVAACVAEPGDAQFVLPSRPPALDPAIASATCRLAVGKSAGMALFVDHEHDEIVQRLAFLCLDRGVEDGGEEDARRRNLSHQPERTARAPAPDSEEAARAATQPGRGPWQERAR